MVVASSYPPAKHVLRDLALTVEHHEDGTSVARLPVVDALLDEHGRVRAGILATLVDAIGGGLAAYAAAPVGPVRATATVVGERFDGAVVLVEIRDVGRDRVAARAVTTVRQRTR